MNPETREHILAQGMLDAELFRCGCEYRKDHAIDMCDFHTGYDEGVDRFRPAAAEEPNNE